MKQALFIAVLMFSQVGVSFSKESGTQSVSGFMDDVKRYCSEQGESHSSQCLRTYLAYRCTVNYLSSDPFFIDDCISATTDLVQELDLTQMETDPKDPNPLQLRQIAFSKKLVQSFSVPVNRFLPLIKKLEQSFTESFEFGNPHSLWLQVLNHHQWNREKALKTMVTVFQDFSGPYYLALVDEASQKTKNQWKRETLLANATALFSFHNLLLQNRIYKNRNPQFSIYPEVKGVNHLSPLAHHFYTPAYLSLRLNRMGYSKSVAFYAAFLFNSTYEFIKLDRKMGTHRWPLQDPLPFNPVKHSLQVEKIYTGYLGALYGVGMQDKALNFQYFQKRLSNDPSGFVSTVHHYGF